MIYFSAFFNEGGVKRRGGGVSITSNPSTVTAATARISSCQNETQHASFEFSFADMSSPG